VGGELGECAGNVGREILVEFPLSSVEGNEIVDREAEDWKKRGNEQYNLEGFEAAIASLDKALEIKPDYHVGWYSREGGFWVEYGFGNCVDCVECDRPNRDRQKMALK
jgi:tetratricopeptide (TPR) repeat protein